MNKSLRLLGLAMLLALVVPGPVMAESRPIRLILNDLVLLGDGDPSALVEELAATGDPFIKVFVESWKTGEVLRLPGDSGPLVLHRVSERYEVLSTGVVYEVGSGQEENLAKDRPSRKLRRILLTVTDTIDLASPNAQVRSEAARKLGMSANAEYLPALQRAFETEGSRKVKRVFEEAILLNNLPRIADPQDLQASVVRLGEIKSILARDKIEKISLEAKESADADLLEACKLALRRIDNHEAVIGQVGNLFRGLSLGSVLLMVSFGLAITFGLMGIINMAHGEFIAIGGYSCYVVQNIFASTFGTQSAAYQWFFIFSLPASFLVAAAIGLAFERSFIRFLYRRPLESLLATWGLSMVMQQVFRLVFGAANVQVNTPDILLGSLDVAGASLSYTRLFVILFAILIVLATWILLVRTNLGLYIRAVMQNRQMASGLGIPVDRVNSLTFAFGCGLASLAGVVLSQLGNVGPSMGQAYIVDSFMVVVAGSVGNLLGAGVSAMGIGLVDQFLQPTLGPVMGKITVFAAIILFLQWKPGGLFPTKSRSLED